MIVTAGLETQNVSAKRLSIAWVSRLQKHAALRLLIIVCARSTRSILFYIAGAHKARCVHGYLRLSINRNAAGVREEYG